MTSKSTPIERKWIWYDVGNSAFTLLVSTLLPIFFHTLAADAGISETDYLAYWAYATSIVTVIVAVLGPTIGSLSRSYFAKIIPQEKSGEYFGIYDIFGKGASFVGTMVVGLVTQISGSQNIGVGVLSVMFPLGLVFFAVSAKMKMKIFSE